MRSKIIILLIALFIGGCFSSRKAVLDPGGDIYQGSATSFCDSLEPFHSLYISRIKAELKLEDEKYDARVSLYYIPDSVIFLTAANTGFEILRAAINQDSLMVINRLDRVVIVYKNKELGYKMPINFQDLEILLNKRLICSELYAFKDADENLVIDKSEPNIVKRVAIHPKALKIKKLEFFHKKTGEYIVGEQQTTDTMKIYSNFLFDDVEILAVGGEHVYNEELDIDLSYNKNKYLVISE